MNQSYLLDGERTLFAVWERVRHPDSAQTGFAERLVFAYMVSPRATQGRRILLGSQLEPREAIAAVTRAIERLRAKAGPPHLEQWDVGRQLGQIELVVELSLALEDLRMTRTIATLLEQLRARAAGHQAEMRTAGGIVLPTGGGA